jgi:1-acyl-sn-glycerol-3-phosphate acyltransferase
VDSEAPRANALGRLLPAAWQEALRDVARGFSLPGLLADLLLTYPSDGGFDPVTTKRWFWAVDQTICRYFRTTVLGAGHIPPGRALIIGCHSGVLPWDAATLVVAIRKHTGRFSRHIGDRLFAVAATIEQFLTTRGVVIGTPQALERLLANDEIVVLFPGGARDMTRPIWERYAVRPHAGFAPGRGGYIKAALRTRTPIVPVAIIGAEETHLMLANVPALANRLGLPLFPIVASPLPLPARIYIRFGEPIALDASPVAADDQATVDCLNDGVRRTLQHLIDDTVAHRRGIYWSSWSGDGNGTGIP